MRQAATIGVLILWSLMGLAFLSPAQAATVTDILQLKLTGKEWCRDDPKFSEAFNVKFTDGETITLKRDVLNNGDLTDIQATINTNGDSATIDAMTLNGEALLANKAGLTVELVLSGTDPGNSAHYLILRGKATLDKAGHVTKVSGTFVFQILDSVNGVPNIECFGSGTFVAQKPSGGGGTSGGAGTLTVANAPASVGGQFVANGQFTSISMQGNIAGIGWAEFNGNVAHAESVAVAFDITNNQISTLIFAEADSNVGIAWGCIPVEVPPVPACSGITINRSAGTMTLTNQVLGDSVNFHPSITLNGTLHFTPF